MRFLTLLLLLCCAHPGLAQTPYRVTGKTPPSFNGKYLYLYGIDYSGLNPKLQDSTLVKDGRFQFSGTIQTPGLLVSLYLKDYQRYFTQIFLEHTPVHLDITMKDSTHATSAPVFARNSINSDYVAWKKATDSVAIALHFAYQRYDSLAGTKADSATVEKALAAVNDLKALAREEKIDFIRRHPGAYLSLYWLRYGLAEDLAATPDRLESIFSSLAAPLRALPEGKELQHSIHLMITVKPGMPLEDFSVPDTAGRKLSLKDFKGKYLLLDFWASWCGPCLASLPDLKDIYAAYHGKGLEVVGISLDTERDHWIQAIQEHGMPWAQVSELDGWQSPVAKQYRITYIPKTILVDENGKIVKVDPDIRAELANLLP